MKPISTKTHGMLDYVSVGFLLALPRILRWPKSVTTLLTGAAISTLAYSLLTRYELGAIRTLPVKTHLGLDALSGMGMTAAPLLLKERDSQVRTGLIRLGLFEIMAALLTDARPSR